MKLNDLIKMQEALRLMSEVLDASYDEIMECFSGILLSEEEVSDVLFSVKESL